MKKVSKDIKNKLANKLAKELVGGIIDNFNEGGYCDVIYDVIPKKYLDNDDMEIEDQIISLAIKKLKSSYKR